MAISKSRIAVIIALTVLGGGLFVVVVQSRWRPTTTNFVKSSRQQPPTSEQSGANSQNPSDVNKESETDSVLAGSKYWNKAVKVVGNLIKDKLKSDPLTDPNLSATWLQQVSNHKPEPASGPETNVEIVKKIPSEISPEDQKVEQTLKPSPAAPTINRQDLPFLTRGSVKIRPERLPPPAHSSDVYISLLTAPKFHDTRISLQYLTWLQTVDPKQVHVVTDKDDNQWIQAIKKEGGHIYLPSCPITSHKSIEMMCCKTGAQFDYWYKAREAGMNYKWYCHFDDDLYMNPRALVNMLSKYDPTVERYLGAWKAVQRWHKYNRLPASYLSPGLLKYTERKRDDFRYANGPSYCISEALMMKVEKYLRGKKFEENCRKSDARMDDVLPGVIIDGVLGVDLTEVNEFMAQMDPQFGGTSADLKERAQQKIITVVFDGVRISDGKFNRIDDPNGVLSYHCLVHPEVSWCHH